MSRFPIAFGAEIARHAERHHKILRGAGDQLNDRSRWRLYRNRRLARASSASRSGAKCMMKIARIVDFNTAMISRARKARPRRSLSRES